MSKRTRVEVGKSSGRKIKVVRNSILPLGHDYGAINLFGILFAKKEFHLTPSNVNHELIHTAQMRELFYLPFYILYIVEWFIRLVQFNGNAFRAYQNISFEREAYKHQFDLDYLNWRPHFAQWRS